MSICCKFFFVVSFYFIFFQVNKSARLEKPVYSRLPNNAEACKKPRDEVSYGNLRSFYTEFYKSTK